MKLLGSLQGRLVAVFVLAGLVPVVLIATLAFTKAEAALEDAAASADKAVRSQAFSNLEAIRDNKRHAVERYFQTIEDQVITFSEDLMVTAAMKDLGKAFRQAREENAQRDEEGVIVGADAALAAMKAELKTYYEREFSAEYHSQNGSNPAAAQRLDKLDADSIALQHAYIRANPHPLGSKHLLDRAADRSSYSKLHERYHPIIRSYLERFGYYDIFLCDPETGDIIYSVFKELDYSTSLFDGPFAKTNFGRAFREANAATQADAVALIDFEPYWPSYEAPASFIASPIFEGEQKLGVAIFQMPLDRISQVMSDRSGLGATGETYLTGTDGLMRSDSMHDPEGHSVVAAFRSGNAAKIDTEPQKAGSAGRSGAVETTNYLGTKVLSAYAPVEVGGLKWVAFAEVHEEEAFASIVALKEASSDVLASLLVWISGMGLLIIALGVLAAFLFARAIAGPLRAISSSLGQSSKELADTSQRMATVSADGAERASVVSSAAEEISLSTKNVAGGIDDLGASIQEISHNAAQAATVAEEAVQMADEAARALEKLSRSSQDIGKVNQLITSVTEQTNLLALNATIEAARAGAAGAGFAVVANEVKELAKETARATADIGERIATIQADTLGASGAIGSIATIIHQIRESQTVIASAVEEQAATTSEIGRSVGDVADGSTEIAEMITGVASVVARVQTSSHETESAASELNGLSGQLHAVIH